MCGIREEEQLEGTWIPQSPLGGKVPEIRATSEQEINEHISAIINLGGYSSSSHYVN